MWLNHHRMFEQVRDGRRRAARAEPQPVALDGADPVPDCGGRRLHPRRRGERAHRRRLLQRGVAARRDLVQRALRVDPPRRPHHGRASAARACTRRAAPVLDRYRLLRGRARHLVRRALGRARAARRRWPSTTSSTRRRCRERRSRRSDGRGPSGRRPARPAREQQVEHEPDRAFEDHRLVFVFVAQDRHVDTVAVDEHRVVDAAAFGMPAGPGRDRAVGRHRRGPPAGVERDRAHATRRAEPVGDLARDTRPERDEDEVVVVAERTANRRAGSQPGGSAQMRASTASASATGSAIVSTAEPPSRGRASRHGRRAVRNRRWRLGSPSADAGQPTRGSDSFASGVVAAGAPNDAAVVHPRERLVGHATPRNAHNGSQPSVTR